MPLTAIDFQSGLFADDSEALSESRYVDGNHVRFVGGRPEVIGGWELLSADTYLKPVRGAHAWAAASGDRALAFGNASQLIQYFGGSFVDITPDKAAGTLNDPFTTTNASKTVRVRDLDHGLKTGDIVTFTHAQPVGGLTLNGSFPVTVDKYDSYTIEAPTAATSAATGGGYVDFRVPMDEGLVDGVGGTGYGTGLYGLGAYGLPTGGDIDPAVWSLDNWGSNLLALRNNGGLFEWQPLTAYDEVLTNGSFDATTGWTAGTGWSISGGQANATAGTASDLTQDATGKLRGGIVYVMEIDVTVTAGSVRLTIERADLDANNAPIREFVGDPIAATGTYRRRFYAPANPTKIIIAKNSTFAGAVKSISIKPESEAYRIQSAPAYSRGMFVDPNRIVVCYGTVESDGDYNPLCVRWSDRERNTVWLADEDNLAGEAILARGSRLIGGLPTRGQNLIWTDDALYTMRFTGSKDDPFVFELSGTGCGLLGKNAAAEHQGMAFWLGRNGQFYIFRGGEPQIIECPNRDYVWGNLANSQSDKVFAGINAEFNEVWFFYPDRRDGTNECSRYIAYNWATNEWFFGEMARTTWVRAGVFPHPIAFDPASLQAFFQERGVTANGDPLQWRLKTGRFNVGDGDTLFAILRYVPDFAQQVGNIDVTFRFWSWARGPAITTRTYEVKPETSEIPLRQMGRVAQIEFSNGTNSRSARWGAQSLDIRPTEARR